jgi:small subunit ribosomal protein S16
VSVKIRLSRFGRKKIPCYRIIVMDSRKRRDGAYLEQLGVYHPKEKPARLEVKEDRAMYWLSVGAQPSDTVRSLFSTKGIMIRHDLKKRGTDPEKIETEAQRVKELAAARIQRRDAEAVAVLQAKATAKANAKAEAAAAEAPQATENTTTE